MGSSGSLGPRLYRMDHSDPESPSRCDMRPIADWARKVAVEPVFGTGGDRRGWTR
jgi:hypothetical protein